MRLSTGCAACRRGGTFAADEVGFLQAANALACQAVKGQRKLAYSLRCPFTALTRKGIRGL